MERKVEGRSVREIWSRRAGWAVCDARIDPRGTAGRVVRILPSRHPGALTDPLRREDPAERKGGLYDLNVGVGAPWMRPRARESTRSRDGARPLTGPSRSGDLVNGSMHGAWAGREDNREKGVPRGIARVCDRLDMIRHVEGMTPGLTRGVIARFTVI